MFSLTAFPCFGDLPMELQLLVWQHATAPEGENFLTMQIFENSLRPNYAFWSVWTTIYAVLLDRVAWKCQGAYSCRKQMMGVSRLCRQVAFEAWKKDVETVFLESGRLDRIKVEEKVQPWRSSTVAAGSYDVGPEPLSLSNRFLRAIIGQLELFEDLTVIHPTYWTQSPWNAAHGRLDVDRKFDRDAALLRWDEQSMIKGCGCGRASTSSEFRWSCVHTIRPAGGQCFTRHTFSTSPIFRAAFPRGRKPQGVSMVDVLDAC